MIDSLKFILSMFLAFTRWWGFLLWGILEAYDIIPNKWYYGLGMFVFSWWWVGFMSNLWGKWREKYY
jgi:hypothetical protein